MTSLREAVERLRAWQNSVDKPSADHKFLADVQLVLDSLTPTEDVRQQISDIIVERLGDAVPPVEFGVVDAIAEFVTSREQAKDAEIAEITQIMRDAQNASINNAHEALETKAEIARLAARLEKANGIINDLLGLPLDNGHACVVDLVSEHVDAATEFLEGWSPDGSTTVPARETALHDGTEGE